MLPALEGLLKYTALSPNRVYVLENVGDPTACTVLVTLPVLTEFPLKEKKIAVPAKKMFADK